MSPEQKQLVEFAIQDLVAEIVKQNGLSPEDAIDRLYHSRFFEHLTNPGRAGYRAIAHAACRAGHRLDAAQVEAGKGGAEQIYVLADAGFGSSEHLAELAERMDPVGCVGQYPGQRAQALIALDFIHASKPQFRIIIIVIVIIIRIC